MKTLHISKAVSPFLLIAALMLTACAEKQEDKVKEETTPPAEDTTGYVDTGESSAPAEPGELVWLEQGWNENDRMTFYNTSQGSQFMPYSWFLALEQAGNNKPFRAAENIKRLGYIPQDKDPTFNRDGLPIGFVKDDIPEDFLSGSGAMHKSRLSSGEQDLHSNYRTWLGFTCAACHTSEIVYDNKTLRIDGGPPLSDFQSLIEGMSAALTATVKGDAKMARFADHVMAGASNDVEQKRLKAEVTAFLAWLDNYIQINYGGLTTPYGYGRLDAFGAILNRVTSSFTGIPANARPSNAPVSYPFLWNTSQLSWVQWNGSANNHIGRNVGEVCGVFAHVVVNTPNEAERFDSSARIRNLFELEELMAGLESPKWDAPLPPIDQAKAEKGKALYAENCVGCHGIRDAEGNFPMTAPNQLGKQFIKINMVGLKKIGTDPLMVMNFVNENFNVDPGIVYNYFPDPLKEKYKPGDKVQRGAMLTVVVGAVIQKQFIAERVDKEMQARLAGYHVPEEKGGPAPPNLGGYKARPLNGIWATAPYLHNGSVPNLDQLLRPEEERVKSFSVGSWEFDAVKVGFKPSRDGNEFKFNTVDTQGRPIPGNMNAGHTGERHTSTKGKNGEWQTYTDEERAQLIEYLKTL